MTDTVRCPYCLERFPAAARIPDHDRTVAESNYPNIYTKYVPCLGSGVLVTPR